MIIHNIYYRIILINKIIIYCIQLILEFIYLFNNLFKYSNIYKYIGLEYEKHKKYKEMKLWYKRGINNIDCIYKLAKYYENIEKNYKKMKKILFLCN